MDVISVKVVRDAPEGHKFWAFYYLKKRARTCIEYYRMGNCRINGLHGPRSWKAVEIPIRRVLMRDAKMSFGYAC